MYIHYYPNFFLYIMMIKKKIIWCQKLPFCVALTKKKPNALYVKKNITVPSKYLWKKQVKKLKKIPKKKSFI